MKKRILYLMHIDWNLIKQRPQYIAQKLSLYNEIIVVCPYIFSRKTLVNNDRKGLHILPIPHVPYRRKSKFLSAIDELIFKSIISFILIIFNPDLVWITFPELYKIIPSFANCKIIYDCMDDAGDFSSDERINLERIALEKELVANSSLILASSQNLIKKIYFRNPNIINSNKLILVRNAFGGDIVPLTPIMKFENKPKIFSVCYIGHVSSWFDFDLILYCLENFANIEFHIIGPVDPNFSPILHERIIYYGSMDHDYLYDCTKKMDLFIMPFKLNELVFSVDPIKIYEYINYNKPIISIYYESLNPFLDFIDIYKTKDELISYLDNFMNSWPYMKYNQQMRIEFLKSNSWESRMELISKNINRL